MVWAPHEATQQPTISRQGCVAYSSSLPLSEWLKFSWFYPEGFKRENILESDRAFVVVGQNLAYKFYKQALRNFDEAWAEACWEVADNRKLAPDVYLGIRLIEFEEDGVEWLPIVPLNKLNPLHPPGKGHLVVLVMRRLPDAGSVASIVSARRAVPLRRAQKLAQALADFHFSSSESGRRVFKHLGPTGLIESIEDQCVEDLSEFIRCEGGFLDPYSQISFEEIRGFLRRFIERNIPLFFYRASAGYLSDSHGDISLPNIWFSNFEPGKFNTVVLGRRRNRCLERINDVLFDVASLAVEFEACGARSSSEKVLSHYFSLVPGAADRELFRFYLVWRAVDKARRALRFGAESTDQCAAHYLSLGLRYALNLSAPFFVVVSSQSADESYAVARSVSELCVETDVLRLGNAEKPLDGLRIGEFDKICRIVTERCEAEKSTLLACPRLTPDEISCLKLNLEARAITYMFVHCSGVRIKQSGARVSPFPLIDLYGREFEPCLFVDPILSGPNMGLYILRELAMRTRPRGLGRFGAKPGFVSI